MKLDYSGIKPLDGSPMMSANCWNTILAAVDTQIARNTSERTTVLEWGAGNSTISLIRKGLTKKSNMKLVSVEHETSFFHWLAESAIAELVEGNSGDGVTVTWTPLAGPRVPLAQMSKMVRRHRSLESAPINLQIILNSKRLAFVEELTPNFSIAPFRLLRGLVKLSLLKLNYAYWVVRGILGALFHGKASYGLHALGVSLVSLQGKDIEKGVFFTHFEKNPAPGCLVLKKDELEIVLWHLPVNHSPFWDTTMVLEGSVNQLVDYVEVPLQEQYDVIFIDGRARTPCIKRVHMDTLLKTGGWLFVHDAFRIEMLEGFRLFAKPPSFILGSNITLNGQKRCAEGWGMPLVTIGGGIDELEQKITQELFVFHNVI